MNACVCTCLLFLVGVGSAAAAAACHHGLHGCFPPMSNTVTADDEISPKIRFYYESLDNYTEVPMNEADNFTLGSWYDPLRTTVVFCHGFTGHPSGPAVSAVIKAYLEQGESNVALLNWDRLAAADHGSMLNSYLNWAMPNAKKLGVLFADALLKLMEGGLDINNTHLIGHSLGAHLIGITGTTMIARGVQLPWITGLDPARLGFDNKSLVSRLHSGSANYVAVIHSDSNKYGYKKSLGTADFWPNHRAIGPVTQPGCAPGLYPNFTPEDLCNHNRCWQILIDSLKYPGTLLGSYARNYKTWKKYSPGERIAVVLEVGIYYANATPGDYYFVTRGESPYGLGVNGL